MKYYLITYDLNRPGQDYSRLFIKIKALGDWYHILQNTWVIKTVQSAYFIVSVLRESVDANDKIFVTELGDWASYNGQDVARWLNTPSR